MRAISRMISAFWSLLILAVLLVATGCKRPGVIQVGIAPDFQVRTQILRKGQTLIWKGEGPERFAIYWEGASPCKDTKLELDSSPNRKGVQTVVCVVETPPTKGHRRHYVTGKPGQTADERRT